MRPHGTGAELERRRWLAVARVRSGHMQTDVATFLGVHPNSVWRWMHAYRERGLAGLRARDPTGRPPKLSAAHLRGAVTVVWDGGPMHKGDAIRQVLHDYPRLRLERLPPYAPELNPIEYLWDHLKYGKLPNFAPDDVFQLDSVLRAT